MRYTTDITDTEWVILEPILPEKKRTRPMQSSKREILNAIFYQAKNGCSWQNLPKDLPPYSTVFWHYKQWRADGTLDKMYQALHEQARAAVQKKHLDAMSNCG